MFKTRYIVLVKKLKDGEAIETDGVIEALATKLVNKKELQVGGLIRDTTGEVI